MPTLTELRAVVEATPAHAAAAAALGQALIDRREHEEGQHWLRQAVRLDPHNAEYPYRLGLLLDELGECEEAAHWLEQARVLDPRDERVLSALGWVFTASLQRQEDARPVFLALLAQSSSSSVLPLVGLCRTMLTDGGGPSTLLPNALTLVGDRRDTALVQRGLAIALMQYGRYLEAHQCLAGLVEGMHDRVPMCDELAELAEVTSALGDRARAAALFERAIAARPTSAVMWRYLAFLFRQGEYERAQPIYRRQETQQMLHAFETDGRRWTGAPIDGKTLVLRTPRGGYGDQIQLSRFAPFVERLGAKVMLQCTAPLRPLLASRGHVHALCLPHDDIHHDVYCHAEAAIMLTEWDWPALASQIPFLRAPADRVAFWNAHISREPAFHIGVCWRAGGSHAWETDGFTSRSMPAECLRPLLEIPGIVVHNLQVGTPGEHELQALSPAPRLRPLPARLTDFAETAAAIQALNLVIAVDTSTLHVAGAVGQQCLLLLPFYGDVRWREASRDGGWYPTCRVFRQPAPGAWSSMMRDVCVEVRRRRDEACAKHESATAVAMEQSSGDASR